ncbi:MAG TPA: tRNA pseudouridine(55) synthase TruB [Verrucomicrobiae bacterium]|nr:tRNA pseudouridine(55) synthase TruB [Verrucomicrobiae bacterium]
MDGVIVVDKAGGWTSHDVVNKLRRIADTKRVGHLGTLDPAATGVLPVVVGKATRLSQFYTRSDKIYEGVVRFGWATTTYDLEGDPVGERREMIVDAAELERHLESFRGEVWQTPPPVSAKRVDGKRAYELARKQVAVELPPVKISIYELELLAVEGPAARLRVHCSGGTYVRSIAHDLGMRMGCGAHLQELRRLASGEFEIQQARTIEQLLSLRADERLLDALIPAREMLPAFPGVYVDEATVREIRNGRDFPASPFRAHPESRHVKAISREGDLIAIGEAVLPNLYHPLVVL